MTLRPYFELVEAELTEVLPSQSEEIAALGFDGHRLLVQFHRFAGLFAGPCTQEEYEHLLHAETIIGVVMAEVAAIDGRWHPLKPFTRRKRRT